MKILPVTPFHVGVGVGEVITVNLIPAAPGLNVQYVLDGATIVSPSSPLQFTVGAQRRELSLHCQFGTEGGGVRVQLHGSQGGLFHEEVRPFPGRATQILSFYFLPGKTTTDAPPPETSTTDAPPPETSKC